MFKLIETRSDRMMRLYSYEGHEYIAQIWGQDTTQCFSVSRRKIGGSGKWAKCPAQAKHYVGRQAVREYAEGK